MFSKNTVQRVLKTLLGLSILVCAVATHADEFDAATSDESIRQIQEFKRTHGFQSIFTFEGNSGTGYENEVEVLRVAEEIMSHLDPRTTIVNIGGTSDGIGILYPLAKRMGFTTTAILAAKNRKYQLSTDVDHFFFVNDEVSGGYLPDSHTLSPTSTVITQVSDHAVAIGGGPIAAIESSILLEMRKLDRFVDAEMNHEMGRAQAIKKGLPEPVGADFLGPVHRMMQTDHSNARCMATFR